MTVTPNDGGAALATAEDGESNSNAKEPPISQLMTRSSANGTAASSAVASNGSAHPQPPAAAVKTPSRKSSAPFPNMPEPTDWSRPADMSQVRANTPLAPPTPQVQPPTPSTASNSQQAFHEVKPTTKATRSKSDASTKSGKGGIFKSMFGGSGNGGGSAVDATEHVRSGFAQLGMSSMSGGSVPHSPANERFDPMTAPAASDPSYAHLRPHRDGPAVRSPSKAGSTDGRDPGQGQRFNLKDLLGAGQPKLARKGSASSKKSDSSSVIDAFGPGQTGYTSGPESVPRPRSRGASSVGGDSATSLSKKYGVCERTAIGKGATSVVRLAHKWDRKEEKLYAVKEFRKRRKNESEKDYVKKLTAEFCISSTLHHMNVVETVDLVQDEHQNWCEVMEYCPGGDLYAAIKRGGMSPSEVECSFKQILQGLGYLHSQGVAHRDIKPENIFFDAKGVLKIGDYGASTVYRLPWESTVHMSTGLCGSEPYIAPEQFTNKHYDARLVDIWACGIVYYCLHFQELPWRVAQMTDTLYAAYVQATQGKNTNEADCPPTINNLSPRACRPLLRKMLEPKPSSRILIEDVLRDKWLATVEVCVTVPKPGHIHVHATQMSNGGM